MGKGMGEQQAQKDGRERDLAQQMSGERGEWMERRMEMADNRTDWAEERTDWAEERTDWAMQRNVYAKERTFSAWMRTGLSSVAVGLGIARLLSAVGQEWVARTIGVLLIFTGGVTYGLSFWRYLQDYRELQEEGVQLTSVWLMGGLTLALMISAVLSMVLLFMQ